ncbi:TRAP transporter small permease [Aminobacter sp. AP02]|uniref:TRAP transporter small permease n=1 Tax=Aminobacter sp. AP02 TaxID=2135737 RepID=UPI000D6CFC05|nr:TRAP transporter small permease [Aminobacter sp. AP02]PWK60797.1 TRAP-type C4-dicarboxylate transport system permease small subunit [Aminobacter sp. AP02]
MRILRSAINLVPAFLLMCMVLLTTLSVISRFAINAPLPDDYELTRLLLGVVVCWGVAGAFRNESHIYLDVFWGRLSDKMKNVVGRIGALISLLIMSGYCTALFIKVQDTMRAHLQTLDFGIPIWGFQAAAWLGILAAVVVLLKQVISPARHEPVQILM